MAPEDHPCRLKSGRLRQSNSTGVERAEQRGRLCLGQLQVGRTDVQPARIAGVAGDQGFQRRNQRLRDHCLARRPQNLLRRRALGVVPVGVDLGAQRAVDVGGSGNGPGAAFCQQRQQQRVVAGINLEPVAGEGFDIPGNFDLAAVLGDGYDAFPGATGGNFLVEILPTLF